MPGAKYDPDRTLRVHVVSQSPHTFAYKLWMAAKDAAHWTPLATGTIETPPTEFDQLKALGADARFAYTLLVGGNPNTDWRVRVFLSQGGAELECSPDAERGVTNGSGVDRRDRAVTLA